MEPEGYTRVGRILRAFGFEGEMKIEIDIDFEMPPNNDNEKGFTPVEAFFLDTRQGFLPYFVEYLRALKAIHPILKFESVQTKEEAVPLQGQALWLPSADVNLSDDLTFGRIIGYTLTDLRMGTVGPIANVLELPQQEMAQVDYQGQEILIPLHDDFIMEIDDAAKTVVMDLPDGLLSVNL